MSVRYGDGNDYIWLPSTAIADTTPVVSRVIWLGDFNQVALQLITTGTITGTWLIEGSNNHVPATSASPGASLSNIDIYGEAADVTVDWTDITALFVKAAAGTAVSNPAGSATNIPAYNKDPLGFRSLRITITAASGSGTARVNGYAKGWA